jgi:signal transduction histidine kinase
MKFAVRDNGPGISAEDLPSVFDRFYQGHRPRTGGADARGTGLGLSICRAVVQSHNGTIEVTSELGKGTQFIVTLPLATVDAGMLESQAE